MLARNGRRNKIDVTEPTIIFRAGSGPNLAVTVVKLGPTFGERHLCSDKTAIHYQLLCIIHQIHRTKFV